MLILDNFFLKYEGGVKLTSQENLASKSPALSRLKQPEFTYNACGPFAKNKERIQKFKETADTNYIYKNELDKAWFQHDMVYGYF